MTARVTPRGFSRYQTSTILRPLPASSALPGCVWCLMSALKERAKAVAARVDEGSLSADLRDKVALDPFLIIGLITQILPLLVQCFQRSQPEPPTPEQTSARIREWNERNPQSLLRKTARRIRGEADDPMTKSDSFELARAVIAEACEGDDGANAAAVAECG